MSEQIELPPIPDEGEKLPPETKYYVDAAGSYLGGYSGVEPPKGAREVAEPPEHVSQTWDGKAWSAAPIARRLLRKSVVQQRLIDAGKMDAAYALLTNMPSAFARWFAPDRPEVYVDDPEAVALLHAVGADPVKIMEPE